MADGELLPPSTVVIEHGMTGLRTWLLSDITCPKPAMIVLGSRDEITALQEELRANGPPEHIDTTVVCCIEDIMTPGNVSTDFKTLCWTSTSHFVYNLTSSTTPVQEKIMELWERLTLAGVPPKELVVRDETRSAEK